MADIEPERVLIGGADPFQKKFYDGLVSYADQLDQGRAVESEEGRPGAVEGGGGQKASDMQASDNQAEPVYQADEQMEASTAIVGDQTSDPIGAQNNDGPHVKPPEAADGPHAQAPKAVPATQGDTVSEEKDDAQEHQQDDADMDGRE